MTDFPLVRLKGFRGGIPGHNQHSLASVEGWGGGADDLKYNTIELIEDDERIKVGVGGSRICRPLEKVPVVNH